MRVIPVVMCGGAGTRLWPASRPARPKQFLDLLGERSIFQETLTRIRDVPGLDEAAFEAAAADAKANCPVSKALAGTTITLTATLK